MKFKEIFDRTIPLDSIVKEEIGVLSESKKNLNIFYKVDLELIKPKEENEEKPVDNNPQQPEQPAPEQQNNAQQPEQPATPEISQTPAPEQQNNVQSPEEQSSKPDLSYALSSVVTEEIIINDKNKIIRKIDKKIPIDTNQANNIQSIDDIISTISKYKKSGVKIFDDFVNEILTLCINQNFNEIKNKLDKKSKIFFEIYYGKSKDDSVGIRINKRQNSDTMTSTMLLDNEIISAKFDVNKINQKIVEYRNYEVKKS